MITCSSVYVCIYSYFDGRQIPAFPIEDNGAVEYWCVRGFSFMYDKGANTLLGLYCLLRVLGQTGTSYKEALGCCTPAC